MHGGFLVLAFIFGIFGVALLAPGAVELAKHDRVPRIETLKKVNSRHKTLVAPRILSNTTTVEINAHTAVTQRTFVPVDGDLEGVPADLASTFWQTTTPIDAQSLIVELRGPSNQHLVLNTDVPRSRRENLELRCTRDQCTSSCSCSDCTMTCNDGAMVEECWRQSAGTGFFFKTTGESDCIEYTVCGNCLFTSYLYRACVPVRYNELTDYWQTSPLKACRYPFTAREHLYLPSRDPPNEVIVEVREDGDPSMAVEQLTRGSRNFGLTRSDRLDVGVPLTVFGALLLLVAILALILAVLL